MKKKNSISVLASLLLFFISVEAWCDNLDYDSEFNYSWETGYEENLLFDDFTIFPSEFTYERIEFVATDLGIGDEEIEIGGVDIEDPSPISDGLGIIISLIFIYTIHIIWKSKKFKNIFGLKLEANITKVSL